jgi:cell division protein FtsN
MQANQNQPELLGKPAKSLSATRLIIALALIGLSILALGLVDRFHTFSARSVTAPHEPAQALITTPVPGADEPSSTAGAPVGPPVAPNIANNEIPVMPARAVSPSTAVPATAKSYIVQVGVFKSPANARTLQKQLQRSGISARLETRVQLGPFRTKHDADQAIARVKKLGIDAVVSSR